MNEEMNAYYLVTGGRAQEAIAALHRAQQAAHDRALEFQARFGATKYFHGSAHFGGNHLSGLGFRSGHPPRGWKRDKNRPDAFVPTSREIHADMCSIVWPAGDFLARRLGLAEPVLARSGPTWPAHEQHKGDKHILLMPIAMDGTWPVPPSEVELLAPQDYWLSRAGLAA